MCLIEFPVSSYKLETQDALEDVVPQKLELLTMIVRLVHIASILKPCCS